MPIYFFSQNRGRLLSTLLAKIAMSACSSSLLLAQGTDSDHRKLSPPPVIVDLGKPNVWTMEQAHYLLERNRNNDLGVTTLIPQTLDPNEVNGIRLQSLRQLVSGSVNFNAADRLNNSVSRQTSSAAIADYNNKIPDLLQKRNAARDRLANDDQQIAAETARLALLKASNDPTSSVVAMQSAKIDGLNAAKTADQADYDRLTSEINSPPKTPDVKATTAEDALGTTTLGDDKAYSSLLDKLASSNQSSKLAASQKLDNYINLQYELVAKQLTLLRDQAGTGNRVLFLELPQSIYYTDKLRLYPYIGSWWGTHLVQAWYRLDEALLATSTEIDEKNPTPPPSASQMKAVLSNLESRYDEEHAEVGENHHLILHAYDCENIGNLQLFFKPGAAYGRPCVAALTESHDSIIQGGHTETSTRAEGVSNDKSKDTTVSALDKNKARKSDDKKDLEPFYHSNVRRSNALAKLSNYDRKSDFEANLLKWKDNWLFTTLLSPLLRPNQLDFYTRIKSSQSPQVTQFSSPPEEQIMYAVDLIPRQSAMNVADTNLAQHTYGFAGLFSFLSGFGAKGRIERQRSQYGQFMQEETYASAFGKGTYEFGWTFGPLPGTNRMAPGLRTTYAVIVVPENTRIVRMLAVGCGYRRKTVPANPFSSKWDPENDDLRSQHRFEGEDCGPITTFDLEVPVAADSFKFQEDKVTCIPVAAGQRLGLEISGRFDEQTGMLVNATPILRVPSITNPSLFQTNYTIPEQVGDSGIKGVFEVVGDTKIVASISMPSTFFGSPQVTLITAGRAITHKAACLTPDTSGVPKPMFSQPPAIANAVAIKYVKPQPTESNPAMGPQTGDANVDKDNDKYLYLRLLGQGFLKDSSKVTLTVGSTIVNTCFDTTWPKCQSGSNVYQFEGPGSLLLKLDRNVGFANGTIDYAIHDGDITKHLQSSYTDDLPPYIDKDKTKCVSSKDKEGSGVTYTCTVEGDFFSGKYKVASPLDKSPTSSQQSDKEWIVTVHTQKPVSVKSALFRFESPDATKNYFTGSILCTPCTTPK